MIRRARTLFSSVALAMGFTALACSRTAPYLILQSLEHYETCAAQSQPAKVREGMAEHYIVRYTSYRVDPPQFTTEGNVRIIAIPDRTDHILYGTGVGSGRIILTSKDDDGNALTSTFDVNVVPQDSYPAYANACVREAGPYTPDPPQDSGIADANVATTDADAASDASTATDGDAAH